MDDYTPYDAGPIPGIWELPGPDGARSLEQLDLDIAETSAHIDAATYRLLADIAEFDRREGWATAGARSCAHWLSFRVGLSPGTARDHVRVARELEEHPLISEAFSKGQVSYSKVRALFRIATPETERELLATARSCTAAQLEKLARAYRGVVGNAEKEKAQRQHEERYLNLSYAEDGSVIVAGRLPPEVGALLEQALVAAETSLADPSDATATRTPERPTSTQRRADALGLIAGTALEHLGTKERGEPYQVVVHVDAEVLADPECEGRCCVENGPTLAAETARRIACDAHVVRIQEDERGNTLSVGRKSRQVSRALWRALKDRDRTCAFPGCECTRGLVVHHLRHWADGGETSLGNLILLCKRCHWLVHEGGFSVRGTPDDPVFCNRGGEPLPQHFEPPELPADPLAALKSEHAYYGLYIDGETSLIDWWGEPMDMDMAIQGLLTRNGVSVRDTGPPG